MLLAFQEDSDKFDILNASLAEEQRKLAAGRATIVQLKNEKTLLRTGTSPIELTANVLPRSFWDWKGKTTYTFCSPNGCPPIISVELKAPTPLLKGIRNVGSFIKENKSELDKGTYQAVYRPGWWGVKQDRDARVKLLIESKYDPSVKRRVREIDKELKNKEKQQAKCTSSITDYQKDLDELKDAKMHAKDRICYLAQQNDLGKPNGLDKSTTEEAKLITLEKSLAEVQSHLQTYKDYCAVLAKIIVKMKFIKKNDTDASTTIFRAFVKNFCKDPDLIHQLEARKKNRPIHGISSKHTDKLKQGVKNFYQKGKEKFDAKSHHQTESRAPSVKDEEAEPALEEMAEQIDSHRYSCDESKYEPDAELEEEFHEADQDLELCEPEEQVIVRY
ncbi:MAG: hypothetical protein ACSNEK_00125 [Parachlamydiaceae bacterium]